MPPLWAGTQGRSDGSRRPGGPGRVRHPGASLMEDETMTTEYVRVSASEIPAGVRWDTPGRHQGQIVEVSYADERSSPVPADDGASYKRIRDRSEPARRQYTFYKRT